jgi:hypothetical protein
MSHRYMLESEENPMQWLVAVLSISLLWILPPSAQGAILVDAAVTPLGGRFEYDVTITNTGPEDVVIVSITDAPIGDPLIGPSLISPVGFATNYDSGLGFIDFFEDVELFAAGTVTSGFSFESLGSPETGIQTFEGLTVSGNFFSGSIDVTVAPGRVVPEASSLMTWLLLLSVGGTVCHRRLKKTTSRHARSHAAFRDDEQTDAQDIGLDARLQPRPLIPDP